MLTHLNLLSMMTMSFADGAFDLMFMEGYSVLFGVFAIGAPR